MNYYIPQWEERTSYGFRRIDPYAKLFEERIIYLGTPISDDVANAVIAQLMCLETMNPDTDISIYINSPGGSFTALTAIYDTMRFIKPDIQTVCLGQAASAAAILLAAGTKGKRYALPHARIMMHQPSSGMGGSASDIKIQAQQSLHIKKVLLELIAEHTGQTVEQVIADADRDRWFTADQAVEYGLVDQVITSAREAADQGRPARQSGSTQKD
jgi:ATP-dependent Clp protease protease subunit